MGIDDQNFENLVDVQVFKQFWQIFVGDDMYLSGEMWYGTVHLGFTRSFVLCRTPALRPYSGPVCLPRERKGIGRCVRCVLAMCRVKEGLSWSEQLVGYFYSAPILDVAYCLA